MHTKTIARHRLTPVRMHTVKRERHEAAEQGVSNLTRCSPRCSLWPLVPRLLFLFLFPDALHFLPRHSLPLARILSFMLPQPLQFSILPSVTSSLYPFLAAHCHHCLLCDMHNYRYMQMLDTWQMLRERRGYGVSGFPYKTVMSNIVVGKCWVNRLSKELWFHREVTPL